MAGEGLKEIQLLRDNGASEEEVAEWSQETADTFFQHGASNEEVNGYFGIKDPDMSEVEKGFKNNFAKRAQTKAPEGEGVAAKEGQPKPKDKPKAEAQQKPTGSLYDEATKETADSFLEYFEAGYDMSVQGLLSDRPDMVLPENAPSYMRLASQAGMLYGDFIPMVAGAVGGGVLGTAAGPLGSIIGAGAGTFALPEMLRTSMINSYERGEVQSFQDFWERSAAVFLNTSKAAVIGGATSLIGGKTTAGLAKTAMPTAVKTVTATSAEVATMVSVGAGLEGRVPEPEEFVDGAIIVGGMKGTMKMASKLRQTYAKTGAHPHEVVSAMDKNLKVQQEMLSHNTQVPNVFAKTKLQDFTKLPKNKIVFSKPFKSKVPSTPTEIVMSKVGERAPRKMKLPDGDQVYTSFVDKLHPINKAVEHLHKLSPNEILTADKNPYMLSRMANDAPAKALHFFKKGTFKYGDSKFSTGEALESVLRDVENVNDFRAYLISERVMELESLGKTKHGFDVKSSMAVVKQHGAKYKKVAKRFYAFENRVLEYGRDAGILSAEAYTKITEVNKHHVSLKRIFEIVDEVGAKKPGGKLGSLKAFKGSDKMAQDPLLSTLENTLEIIKAAENNRPLVALIEQAKGAKGQELIKKAKVPAKPVKISKSQLKKSLKDSGMSAELSEIVSEAAGELTTFTRQKRPLTDTQFSVFEGGKLQVYETTPDLAHAIKTLGGDQIATGMAMKLLRSVTAVKKIAITATPDFQVRNLLRDTVMGSVVSEANKLSVLDVAKAMRHVFKKDQVYWDWVKAGGANGSFLELSGKFLTTDLLKMQQETGFLNRSKNVIRKPIEFLRASAVLIESSPRLAEFKNVTKGKTDPASIAKGGFASREITLDFQRVGAKISSWNAITAFMNVGIQGIDKNVRAFRKNPGKMTARGLTYITAPSVLLWWANKDDPRYQELPNHEKDFYWNYPITIWSEAENGEESGQPPHMVKEENGKTYVNTGPILKIPKPMELGIIFGTFAERLMDAAFTDNPESFADFGESVTSFAPGFVPDGILPVIEQTVDKNFFTGNDIVPHHLKDVFPEYQFTEYTSDTAKVLAQVVSSTGILSKTSMSSPAVIENYLRSWTGTLGRYAIDAIDEILQKSGAVTDVVEPAKEWYELPFIRSFFSKYPKAGAKSIHSFYNNYEKFKAINSTVKLLTKRGDIENLEKEFGSVQNMADLLSKMDETQKAIGEHGEIIKQIYVMDGLNKDEKRQFIDMTYFTMIAMAKDANTTYHMIKKGMENVNLKEK